MGKTYTSNFEHLSDLIRSGKNYEAVNILQEFKRGDNQLYKCIDLFNGDNPLHIATAAMNSELVIYILSDHELKNAFVYEKNSAGESPLYKLADIINARNAEVGSAEFEMAELYLEHNVDWKRPDQGAMGSVYDYCTLAPSLRDLKIAIETCTKRPDGCGTCSFTKEEVIADRKKLFASTRSLFASTTSDNDCIAIVKKYRKYLYLLVDLTTGNNLLHIATADMNSELVKYILSDYELKNAFVYEKNAAGESPLYKLAYIINARNVGVGSAAFEMAELYLEHNVDWKRPDQGEIGSVYDYCTLAQSLRNLKNMIDVHDKYRSQKLSNCGLNEGQGRSSESRVIDASVSSVAKAIGRSKINNIAELRIAIQSGESSQRVKQYITDNSVYLKLSINLDTGESVICDLLKLAKSVNNHDVVAVINDLAQDENPEMAADIPSDKDLSLAYAYNQNNIQLWALIAKKPGARAVIIQQQTNWYGLSEYKIIFIGIAMLYQQIQSELKYLDARKNGDAIEIRFLHNDYCYNVQKLINLQYISNDAPKTPERFRGVLSSIQLSREIQYRYRVDKKYNEINDDWNSCIHIVNYNYDIDIELDYGYWFRMTDMQLDKIREPESAIFRRVKMVDAKDAVVYAKKMGVPCDSESCLDCDPFIKNMHVARINSENNLNDSRWVRVFFASKADKKTAVALQFYPENKDMPYLFALRISEAELHKKLSPITSRLANLSVEQYSDESNSLNYLRILLSLATYNKASGCLEILLYHNHKIGEQPYIDSGFLDYVDTIEAELIPVASILLKLIEQKDNRLVFDLLSELGGKGWRWHDIYEIDLATATTPSEQPYISAFKNSLGFTTTTEKDKTNVHYTIQNIKELKAAIRNKECFSEAEEYICENIKFLQTTTTGATGKPVIEEILEVAKDANNREATEVIFNLIEPTYIWIPKTKKGFANTQNVAIQRYPSGELAVAISGDIDADELGMVKNIAIKKTEQGFYELTFSNDVFGAVIDELVAKQLLPNFAPRSVDDLNEVAGKHIKSNFGKITIDMSDAKEGRFRWDAFEIIKSKVLIHYTDFLTAIKPADKPARRNTSSGFFNQRKPGTDGSNENEEMTCPVCLEEFSLQEIKDEQTGKKSKLWRPVTITVMDGNKQREGDQNDTRLCYGCASYFQHARKDYQGNPLEENEFIVIIDDRILIKKMADRTVGCGVKS